MSIHPSLKGIDTLRGERSVLTRIERITKLRQDGRFEDENTSAWGLPKVRTKFKIASTKKKKDDEEEAKEGTEAKAEKAE